MNKKRAAGFSLIELMVVLALSAPITLAYLNSYVEDLKKDNSIEYAVDLNDVLNGIDQRISVDGYDFEKWNVTEWDSANFSDLISKELQAINSKCGDGEWVPIAGNDDLSLVPCSLLSRFPYKMNIDAKIDKDDMGFINKFEIIYSFDDDDAFEKYYHEVDHLFKSAKQNSFNSVTGTIRYEKINLKTDETASIKECIQLQSGCAFKATLNRLGGSEYLRVDGLNSMIESHITFIESKGNSPLKCIRWKNIKEDNTGLWFRLKDTECGIGLYSKEAYPIMVDIAADSGTFKNILLDKECSVFEFDGVDVVNSNRLSPCGMFYDNNEMYQVVENINAQKIEVEQLYSSKATIKNLVSDSLSAQNVSVSNELKTDLINSYVLNGVIEVNSRMTINELLTLSSDLYVYGSASIDDLTLRKINIEDSSCEENGSLSIDKLGALLNCTAGKWESTVSTSVPIGTVAMWTKVGEPKNWLEMNGQTIPSQYQKLIDLIGAHVPDLRGQFVRGYDNGKGVDAKRKIGSYQKASTEGLFTEFANSGSQDFKYTNIATPKWTSNYDAWDSKGDSSSAHSVSGWKVGLKVSPLGHGETRPLNIALMYIIKAK